MSYPHSSNRIGHLTLCVGCPGILMEIKASPRGIYTLSTHYLTISGPVVVTLRALGRSRPPPERPRKPQLLRRFPRGPARLTSGTRAAPGRLPASRPRSPLLFHLLPTLARLWFPGARRFQRHLQCPWGRRWSSPWPAWPFSASASGRPRRPRVARWLIVECSEWKRVSPGKLYEMF